jgi:hypothetical protein
MGEREKVVSREVFLAGAASAVLEVFVPAKRPDSAISRKHAASCPLPPNSEHLKGQLALVTPLAGSASIPATKYGHSALHLLLHTVLKQATS